MTKTHMTKNFHKKKKKKKTLTTNAHHNKKSKQTNAPPKFQYNQNFSRIHTQLPNFSIAMQKRKKKFPHKEFPTSSCTCTNKFSHSQNHNHINFPRINITYPTKFFHKLFIPINLLSKFFHDHKTKFTHANKLSPHAS